MNPFEGDEDGVEESPLTDRGEDEEEVDEEEVEAFLDGELTDRLPFLQERSRQGIAIDDRELSAFGLSPSRAEEALRTCGFPVKYSSNTLLSLASFFYMKQETLTFRILVAYFSLPDTCVIETNGNH